ncbi:hypothetical protein HOLleu_10382 [Holothuria leucospilota]|uniref:Uncharacterized protein n=1 Tax=Holothuria leucospilota TaxID=206669 RepID=A0A9Q1CD14_HOLLE|nr:hypothetical protein HOLleu_10382 [Holothuria leucospilota]
MDAINQKLRRLNMSDEKRTEYNKKAAIRMANMRRRKAEAKATEAAKGHPVKIKTMTRAESIKETEKRRKAAAYKREQRAKLTTRQKEEINRKRREKARK